MAAKAEAPAGASKLRRDGEVTGGVVLFFMHYRFLVSI
jgi:hypothetical protein